MNHEQLVTELKERGFDYLSTSRCSTYINDAYLLDICEEEDWPFLEETEEGSAPLEIADVRAVEYVVNSTQGTDLLPIDRRHLVADVDSDLSTKGTPTYWYLSQGKIVNVFPANTTDTLQVRYYKVPSSITGTESPLVPSRFHTLIVDFAVARAYEDADDYELGISARENALARLERMRASFGIQNRDGATEYVELTDPESLY